MIKEEEEEVRKRVEDGARRELEDSMGLDRWVLQKSFQRGRVLNDRVGSTHP